MSPDDKTLAFTMGIVSLQHVTDPETSTGYVKWVNTLYPVVFLKEMPDGEPFPVTSSYHDTFAPYQREWKYLSWSPEGDKLVVSTFAAKKIGMEWKPDCNIYMVPVSEYITW